MAATWPPLQCTSSDSRLNFQHSDPKIRVPVRSISQGKSVAKFLRFIACDYRGAQGRPDSELSRVARSSPETWHLPWMYERYATPIPTDGVSKVNVSFMADASDVAPSACLGIVETKQHFDATQFQALALPEQQWYMLDRLHDAVRRCATHFGWSAEKLDDAVRRIVDENFHFSFFWKKPLTSPDRHWKVQAFVQGSWPARIDLVFFDATMKERHRTLLTENADAPGVVGVSHKNGRDYWTCTPGGDLQFHYPRAEQGDPHGEYDLGRMYFDGLWILPDRERGMALIRSAAEQRFAHAIRFLANLDASSPAASKEAGTGG
jgi:hypothetical protein